MCAFSLHLFFAFPSGILAAAWAMDWSPKLASVPTHRLVGASALLVMLVSPINLLWMSRGTECLTCVAFAHVLQVLCSNPAVAAVGIHLAGTVPPHLRFTSLALAHSAGLALFGRSMPRVATAIQCRLSAGANGTTRGPSSPLEVAAPALYLSALAAMAAAALLLGRLPGVKRMRQTFELAVS